MVYSVCYIQYPQFLNSDLNILHFYNIQLTIIFLILDQWSPLNMEGKKLYDREFLLQLQFSKESTAKPKDMPDLPDIVIENVS